MNYIAYGLFVLIGGMIISSILGGIRSFYTITEPKGLTILLNYTYVIFPLVGLYFVFKGSQVLLSLTKKKIFSVNNVLAIILPLFIIGLTYVWIVFTNQNRQVSLGPGLQATYYLSDVFIALTIVLPMLIAWGFGSRGAVNILSYYREIKGIIYQDIIKKFAVGIMAVVLGSVMLQGIISLGTSRLLSYGIGVVMILVYVFLGIQGVGYMLIYNSSKNLQKLEGNE